MYLINVDESGMPDFDDKENFVLVAYIIQEENFEFINNEFNKIKTDYFPHIDPDDLEIHATDLFNKKGPFKNLEAEKRWNFLKDIYTAISRFDGTIISIVIRKEKIFPNKQRSFDITEWGYRLLFERLCKFLDKKNVEKISGNKPPERGLLLLDAINIKINNSLRRKILHILKSGSFYQPENKWILEDVIFTNSAFRNCTQIADLIAYIIRRVYRGSDTLIDIKSKEYFKLIELRFDKDSQGNYEGCGIKIFP